MLKSHRALRISQAVVVGVAIFAGLCHGVAWAEDGDEADSAPVQTVKAVKAKKSKGGKSSREKDATTDGTEAPDRFKADTVIKSQYKLNGAPLEVDPD